MKRVSRAGCQANERLLDAVKVILIAAARVCNSNNIGCSACNRVICCSAHRAVIGAIIV